MSNKPYDHLSGVPKLPKAQRLRKRRPKRVAVVDEDNCSGCQVCTAFCPANCIEPVPAQKYDDTVIPPMHVRYRECLGCQMCAMACEKLTWNAISMWDTDDFEKAHSVTV